VQFRALEPTPPSNKQRRRVPRPRFIGQVFLLLFSSFLNTTRNCHSERSKPTLLFLNFAPAKLSACAVEEPLLDSSQHLRGSYKLGLSFFLAPKKKSRRDAQRHSAISNIDKKSNESQIPRDSDSTSPKNSAGNYCAGVVVRCRVAFACRL
jgi:hypothetical protein